MSLGKVGKEVATKNRNSLRTAYTLMLKERYCDEGGSLLPKYPSFHQFRYFYRKHKSLQDYYISREGIRQYQRDHRPLLGDGVQEFASHVGVAMLDATICDIYLVNEAGGLVGPSHPHGLHRRLQRAVLWLYALLGGRDVQPERAHAERH